MANPDKVFILYTFISEKSLSFGKTKFPFSLVRPTKNDGHHWKPKLSQVDEAALSLCAGPSGCFHF